MGKPAWNSIGICGSRLGARLALLVLLITCSCIPVAESPQHTPPPAALEKPAWLDEEPIIIVGGWDDMFLFRRRVGKMSSVTSFL